MLVNQGGRKVGSGKNRSGKGGGKGQRLGWGGDRIETGKGVVLTAAAPAVSCSPSQLHSAFLGPLDVPAT